MVKEIVKEIRLLICQWLMGFILLVVPKCEEGETIVIKLKEATEKLIELHPYFTKQRKGENMSIKKLIVKELEVTAEDIQRLKSVSPGYKYSYFEDPETGKMYRPVDGFTVIGKDLSDRFVEVEAS